MKSRILKAFFMNRNIIIFLGIALVCIISTAVLFLTESSPEPTQPAPQSSPAKAFADSNHPQRLYTAAQRAYGTAENSPAGYKKTLDCCMQILKQYPQSPQAPKAKVLLSNLLL